jgi:hypothetical protein
VAQGSTSMPGRGVHARADWLWGEGSLRPKWGCPVLLSLWCLKSLVWPSRQPLVLEIPCLEH